MLRYNWERKDWPNFKYSTMGLDSVLVQIARNEGKYDGILDSLPKNIKADAIIDLMVIEAIKTSEIEGEFFSRQDVLSSIKKNLGVHHKEVSVKNKNAESVSKMMVAVRISVNKPLSKKMLCEWHELLLAHEADVQVGKYRTHKEPMQVVSGPVGKTTVHFEAPPSAHMNVEMKAFVKWFNDTSPSGKNAIVHAPVRAAVVHLYFLSIHPFEDGNGRIGRALAEKVLAQADGKPVLLSLSYAIEKNRKNYYTQLQNAQTKNEITPWVNYFVHTILEAQLAAEKHIHFSLSKVRFVDEWKNKLNKRQWKVVLRMLDEGPEGFEGGMNARKYCGISKASKATATRDLQSLVSMGIFKSSGGGRSVSYELMV